MASSSAKICLRTRTVPEVLVRCLPQGDEILTAARVIVRREATRVLHFDFAAKALDAPVVLRHDVTRCIIIVPRHTISMWTPKRLAIRTHCHTRMLADVRKKVDFQKRQHNPKTCWMHIRESVQIHNEHRTCALLDTTRTRRFESNRHSLGSRNSMASK
jgi:hypothetical protein